MPTTAAPREADGTQSSEDRGVRRRAQLIDLGHELDLSRPAGASRAAMADLGVDVLLLSVGHDLPYLTGYYAMPLERLTMLVVPRDADATMIIPGLEAPRVSRNRVSSTCVPWEETEDPTAIVAGLSARLAHVAVGDQMWARFLVELLRSSPGTVPAGGRRRRSVANGEGRSRDRGARRRGRFRRRDRGELQAGEIPLVGRTEAEVRPSSARGSSPGVTTRSTSRSSRPARTPRVRTITPAPGDPGGRDRAV